MVEDLIRRARQRLLLNEALAQCAFAAAVAVGGFALLLVVGTRYMEWWTLAIFAAAGVAIGAYRVFRRTPDPYTTAVRLDENTHLQDALSTAFYFSREDARAHGAGSAQFLRSQRAQAEAAAAKVHLEKAAPFVVPRSLYAMAGLCVLASVLIALRFGFGHGLDLRPPITQFLLEDQAAIEAKHPGAFPKGQQTPWTKEMQSLLTKIGLGPRPDQLSQGDDEDELERAIQDALETPPDLNSKAEKGTGSGQGGQSKESAAADSPAGDPLDNGEDLSKNQSASEAKPGTKGSRASGKTNSDSQDNLLSRLKEAVSSMLSQADQNAAQKGSKMKNSDGSQSKQGKGDQQQAESEAEAQGQTDADGKNGMQTQGKMNSRTGSQPAQGATGAGSEDGSKEIREAEQLKAMGKISEIIGQRAANVSGETTIEVESGSQKLHTNYSKTSAAHAETDGDVTRDEIPLSMQAYVQQYFAEVRKAKPAKQQPVAK